MDSWDTGETMFQGGELQGNSGSTGISFSLVSVFLLVSSSSSSVGVLQVEDTRRVTQATLVIVDDFCLFICFEIQ